MKLGRGRCKKERKKKRHWVAKSNYKVAEEDPNMLFISSPSTDNPP